MMGEYSPGPEDLEPSLDPRDPRDAGIPDPTTEAIEGVMGVVESSGGEINDDNRPSLKAILAAAINRQSERQILDLIADGYTNEEATSIVAERVRQAEKKLQTPTDDDN